jgi:predicted ATPase
MKIVIKIKEDIRNVLKYGEEYAFDFNADTYNKEPFIYIVGENGAGKSTLINCIRQWKCNNKGEDRNGWAAKLGYGNLEREKFSEKCEIETDFEKIYFLSSEFDDTRSLDNCTSAESLFKNGGYMNRFKSNGEAELNLLGKWFVENRDNFDNKTLIVFDEVDKGLSLGRGIGVVTMMENIHK